MATKVCAGCAFWSAPAGGTMGECRKAPPVPFMVLAQAGNISRLAPGGQQTQQVMPRFLSSWPAAPADGWCGSWEDVLTSEFSEPTRTAVDG